MQHIKKGNVKIDMLVEMDENSGAEESSDDDVVDSIGVIVIL